MILSLLLVADVANEIESKSAIVVPITGVATVVVVGDGELAAVG